MTKVESFISQFVALVKGDEAAVIGAKVFRQATSAFKVQIAALEGGLIRKEDQLENAKENLEKARLNFGVELNDAAQNGGYCEKLISCQNVIEQAEKDLVAHKKTIAFLESQYAKLKTE